MNGKRYPTDLTDAQWEILKPLVIPPAPKKRKQGRPVTIDLRRILDGIFYITRGGCQYRMLPHDLPPWQTVYYYLRKWRKDGTLLRIHDALREQVREKDKPTERTTASVDSQTTDSHGAREDVEFDGGKKLDGRKRHIVVDSLGLMLAVVITAGNVTDAQGGMACLEQMDPKDYPEVKRFFGDNAYPKEGFPEKIREWKQDCELNIISRKEDDEGFVKLPIRWVVERTNAWMTKQRRLCRSYEHTTDAELGFVRVAMISRMLRRLSPSPPQSPFRFPRKPVTDTSSEKRPEVLEISS
jgi:putative transposase